MNNHHQAATDGLNAIREQLSAGMAPTEAIALAVTQTRAMLAVAEEQSKTNAHLETANLINFALLSRETRDWEAFRDARKAAHLAMTGKEWVAPNEDDAF